MCGICGTLAGGYILDYIDATISNAFKVNYVTQGKCFLRFPFIISTFADNLCFESKFSIHLTLEVYRKKNSLFFFTLIFDGHDYGTQLSSH